MKMEPMKCGTEEFEVHLPADLIAAELEPNQVELPQRTRQSTSAGPWTIPWTLPL